MFCCDIVFFLYTFIEERTYYFAKIIQGQTICNVLSPFSHFLKDLFAADISGMI
jgi:hypothetical protein